MLDILVFVSLSIASQVFPTLLADVLKRLSRKNPKVIHGRHA